MPNRILREGILTSPRIKLLGWAEEVFYRRLMSVVDDFGRYFADLGLLRAACYPRQLNKVSDPDIGKWLRSCVDAGLVRVYPAEDGESYLELLDFRQQVRAKESKFPGMRSTCVADAQQTPANAHLDVSVGEGVSGSSVAKATDGAAGPAVSQSPENPHVQTKAELWLAAVSVLKAGGCDSDALARSFMGKLVKDYGQESVSAAVASAATAQPADAREYLKATCQRLKGERKDPVTVADDPRIAQTAAAAEAERRRWEALKNDPEEQAKIRAAIKTARQRLKAA